MTTSQERGRRWVLRNKRIVGALTKIHSDKRTFSSQEVAKLADMTTNRMGQILGFTEGYFRPERNVGVHRGTDMGAGMSSAAIHHCTCPQRIQIENRQARNRKREVDPALVAIKKQWCLGKVCSCGCGRPANTPHHPRGELYENDLAYADPVNWEPYYHTCHHNLHKGRVRCPTCTGWMTPGREKCAKCEGWRSRNVRHGKIKHPCRFNVGRQKCIPKGVCPHSWRNAKANCRTFETRKPVSP